MTILSRAFYDRSALLVAPELLGKVLVRQWSGQIISGRIIEVEAYLSENDPANHGHKGQTKHTAALFGKPGTIYIHSMHQWQCFNLVTEAEGRASSVLIRALEPLSGIELMKAWRKKNVLRDLTSVPGKLAQALHIDKSFNGLDSLVTGAPLQVVDDGFIVPEENILTTTRVGISQAMESKLRFYIRGNPYVSKL